jgi:hypothetical protein
MKENPFLACESAGSGFEELAAAISAVAQELGG